MEIQQSPYYAGYIRKLGWIAEKCDDSFLYIKHIPLIGSLAKLQRCQSLPGQERLLSLLQKHQVTKLAIEPASTVPQKDLSEYSTTLLPHVQLSTPFLATKTILIDLISSEQDIFNRFNEAKRRAVRRAISHHVLIKKSTDIQEFIKIKNKSAGLFGFITTYGVKQLWESFSPDNAAILLAYDKDAIGGVLLLFVDKRAYYWLAGATKHGKKLFAPTLLVWEALKFSKKHGCTEFDFVGVRDERLPKQNKEWKGFTKFKEGFGGREIYYPSVSLVRE